MSKKTQDALRKYYSAFNYDTGVKVYKRGGKMGFTTNKFPWGGPTGDTWIPEIDNTTVDESFNPDGSHGTDYYIRQYWNEHPEELFKTRGVNDSVIADWKSGQGAGTNWSSLVGTVGSIVGEGMENFNTMDAKEKDLSRRIGSYGQGVYDGITDNLGLIAASNNIGELKGIQREDIRDKSIGQDAFSAVTKGLNAGLSTGNIYVGLGVAAGDIGRSILERIKARNITDRLNEQTIRQNAQLNHQLRNASEVVDNRNFLRAMQGYYNNPFEYALGGEMRSHGSDWNSGLTFINAGGRHEENPYEGVPSGVDDKGVPNLVEEGEVIWNDEYVFSDRLKVPKELANKYKLGGDKTFAEAIEEVTRESRTRPNDPISNETNRAIVNEFMDAQEAIREQEQLAAREELEAAQAQDFLSQLDAAQGMAPSMGAPVDMGQMGMGMPDEAPVTEGEMMPPGYAFGGPIKGDTENPIYKYWSNTKYGRDLENLAKLLERFSRDKKATAEALANGETSGMTERTANRRLDNVKFDVLEDRDKREHRRLQELREAQQLDRLIEGIRNTGVDKKALGGNKFDDGSWKRYATESTDSNGNTIYTTSDGRIFYSEAGAQKYIELNKERLISNLSNFEASPIPARIIANRTGIQLPRGIKAVYSKGRNGQKGPVHHYETSDGLNMGTDLDKAIRHQNALDGVNAPVQEAAAPIVQEAALPNLVSSSTVPASTVTAARTLPAAQPQVQQVAQPQVVAQQIQPEVTINSKGQEEETLPDGIKVVYSKGRNGNRGSIHHYETSDGLNMGTNRNKAVQHQTRLNQGNTQVAAAAKVVPSPSFQDINIFSTPDSGFDLFSYPPRDYVSAPVAQAAQPQNTSVPAEEQVAAVSTTSNTAQASGKTFGRASSSTGSSISSGNTIDYNKKLGLKASREWEAQSDYQNFLKYMRGQGKDSPEAKQWMDFIQDEIRKSGSSYTLKDFNDWSHLAEDGKIGPVHKATLLAAQNYAKRQNAPQLEGPVQAPQSGNRVTPSSSTETTESLNAAIEATRGTQQSPVTTQPAAPNFKYRPTWQRMAPVYGAGAAALYGMINRPDYFNADSIIDAARAAGVPVNIPVQTIGDYRVRKPYDERYLVNMANQNMAAGQRSLYNTSGGNRAMDMLGAMNLAHNNQVSLGEIMRQAYLANRQDDAQVSEFNRGTNIQNMNAINQRNLAQAQLNSQRQSTALSGLARGYGMRQGIKDNWDAATIQSLNSMLASLGAIGKENEEYNILTSMAEQGYFPYYYGDKSILQHVPYTVSKNGGKLNKKKRRF